MATVITSMSMSLDGFITGPNDGPEHGLGEGGEVLHEWITPEMIEDPRAGGATPGAEVLAELFRSLGAIVMGGHSFRVAVDAWGDNPTFRVPVFVATHHPKEPMVRGETTYVFVRDGFERAIELAKTAAGDGYVSLHGAAAVQAALRAGVLDELQVHLVPVLLGRGKPLFDGSASARLERTRVVEEDNVTHLRYRVLK
jgi:dihydrofolate reductase